MIIRINEDMNVEASSKPFDAEAEPGVVGFETKRQMQAALANWPTGKLIQLWNSFAGVVPFADLKPVKKFETRGKALARLWNAFEALATGKRLADDEPAGAPVEKPKKEKREAKLKAAAKPKTSPKPAAAKKESKREKAMKILARKGGCTLDQLMKETDSSRGTAANLINYAKKHGDVTVTKQEDGTRVYAL